MHTNLYRYIITPQLEMYTKKINEKGFFMQNTYAINKWSIHIHNTSAGRGRIA